MVKRIILWKIRDDQNKQNNLNLLRKGLLELSNKISDIISLEVGLNYGSSDYDIIFVVAFSAPFLLKQFQSHPEFLKIQQFAQSITINMVFCDYMAETYGSSPSELPNGPSMGKSIPMNNFSNTNSIPNLNNLRMNNAQRMNTTPNINNIGMNNIGMNNSPKNSGFMNKPANNMNNNNNLDITKPFSPINSLKNNKNNQNSVPTPYGNKNTPAPVGFNQNQNQNQYTGFGNISQSKQGVNFTSSEHLNQFRFSGKDSNGDNINNSGSWKCSKCGKTNSSFINMCSCGKRKPIDNMPAMSISSDGINGPNIQSGPSGLNGPSGQNESSGLNGSNGLNGPSGSNGPSSSNNQPVSGWVCPSCGKNNNDFMKICICGHRKVDNNNNNNNNNRGNNNMSPFANNGGPGSQNKPMMPKSSGMNNIKSPNNNDFFNNFNGGANSPRNNRMNNMGGNNRMNNSPPGFNNMSPNNRQLGMNNMGGSNKNISGNDGLPSDSWKCPRCGKVLGNFVGQCICGQRKPSRPSGGQTGMRFV